jgi:GDP-4-dehydro-6-deoxy-D-mannose reductase
METKVLLVSSAEVYGHIRPDDLPVDEETPHRPANPYAVSKIAQDYLGFQYYLSYKLPIIRVRPFNHIGPGQKLGFVVSDFAKQVAEIEKGSQPPIIRVGNLEARRDFTDVRDIVKAYPLLLEKGEPGEVYNAGSGNSHSAKEIMEILLTLTTASVQVEQDPDRMRPSDIPEIRADITKIIEVTGWKPEIPFEQTIKDTLDYFRKVV